MTAHTCPICGVGVESPDIEWKCVHETEAKVSELTGGEWAMAVLTALSEMEPQPELYWSVVDGMPHFYVNCNDLFLWGCADAEEITPGNLQLLVDTYNELRAIDRDKNPADRPYLQCWANEVWACRVRGMKPQKPAYDRRHPKLQAIYDAIGGRNDY